MKSTRLHLAKTSLVKNCSASMFSNAQRPMSTFALPIVLEEVKIGSTLEIAGQHASRLSQKQINRFMQGGNIFPHRAGTYFIFESENKEEEVDGLYDTVYWKEPVITVKPIGVTTDGEINLFYSPSLS